MCKYWTGIVVTHDNCQLTKPWKDKLRSKRRPVEDYCTTDTYKTETNKTNNPKDLKTFHMYCCQPPLTPFFMHEWVIYLLTLWGTWPWTEKLWWKRWWTVQHRHCVWEHSSSFLVFDAWCKGLGTSPDYQGFTDDFKISKITWCFLKQSW